MLPNPLHPAVVHFPIVLMVLLPLAMLGALWTIRRGAKASRAWGIAVAVSGALFVSAWVALKTGQAQEDKVEPVVAEQPLNAHEEAAELFLIVSGVVLVLAGAGLAPGALGRWSRVLAIAGSAGLVVAGWRVGSLGGELVYRHGAASAYATPGSVPGGAMPAREREEAGGR
jgi:uncharacterized membrane protein